MSHISKKMHLFERSGGGNCFAKRSNFRRSGESSEVFDFVYTPTHTHTPTNTPLHKTLLRTYLCGGVKEFRFCILGAKFGPKNVLDFYLKSLAKNLPRFTAFQNFFFLKKINFFYFLTYIQPPMAHLKITILDLFF
jgi:hypothetical protein